MAQPILIQRCLIFRTIRYGAAPGQTAPFDHSYRKTFGVPRVAAEKRSLELPNKQHGFSTVPTVTRSYTRVGAARGGLCGGAADLI
jgi:hypothetical protein